MKDGTGIYEQFYFELRNDFISYVYLTENFCNKILVSL